MAEAITPTILNEFKERMKLGDDEDTNLIRVLNASHQALYKICGHRDILEDEQFKEIVFERARYAINNGLEYFNDNFLSQINSLGLEKAVENLVLDGEV